MSSRTSSELGSLGERIARTQGAPEPSSARHVLAQDAAGAWHPALLVGWTHHPTGWWGRVALMENGEPALVDLVAGRLRPSGCPCCARG